MVNIRLQALQKLDGSVAAILRLRGRPQHCRCRTLDGSVIISVLIIVPPNFIKPIIISNIICIRTISYVTLHKNTYM